MIANASSSSLGKVDLSVRLQAALKCLGTLLSLSGTKKQKEVKALFKLARYLSEYLAKYSSNDGGDDLNQNEPHRGGDRKNHSVWFELYLNGSIWLLLANGRTRDDCKESAGS
ncbi:hypothetical protein ACTXT7_015484 [Hymenolepis weldensis]